MAGKFTNTQQYIQTVNSLVNTINDKLNNPYYKFTDKKPTVVTYYKINKERTTLDEASGLAYQSVGNVSPIKYNRINNFLLYGIERIVLDYNVEEHGLEASPITGTAIILPNTIEPLDGDFFLINQIKEKGLLFKVNKVTPDTLDNGSNIYQIDYQLEFTEAQEAINKQVVKVYNFYANNIGTDFKTTFTEEEVILIEQYEALIDTYIQFYNALFFDDKLQTYVYMYNGFNVYDPYMIEFIIRNKLFQSGDSYTYVSHATALEPLFPIEYAKTIFYQLENTDMDIAFEDSAYLELITDPNSLFVTRIKEYYQVHYGKTPAFTSRVHLINPDFSNNMRLKIYSTSDLSYMENFIISLMNNKTDSYIGDLFSNCKNIDWEPSITLFYLIPMCIYALQKYINTLMS